MCDFLNKLKVNKDIIDKRLSFIYNNNNEFHQMCKYSFLIGGKRIRAILLMESHNSYKSFSKIALEFSVALELIHNYSLVHDDLPEMDNDKYRRGQLSVYGKYGHANAVLVGDELLNDASLIIFKALGEISDLNNLKNAIKASEMMMNLSGIEGMVYGQFLDLKNSVNGIEDLEEINNLKTASLFKAAVLSGAILAGAPQEDLVHLENYSNCIGLAYQLKDDLFDYDEDVKLGKKTFSTFLGKQKVIKRIDELNNIAINEINKISGEKRFFVDFIEYLTKREN